MLFKFWIDWFFSCISSYVRLLNLQWCLEENVGLVKQLKSRRTAWEREQARVWRYLSFRKERKEQVLLDNPVRANRLTASICSYLWYPGNSNAPAYISYSIFKLLVSYRSTTPYLAFILMSSRIKKKKWQLKKLKLISLLNCKPIQLAVERVRRPQYSLQGCKYDIK